jgi:uridine kinase
MSPIEIPSEPTNMIHIPHGNDRLGINDQLAYGSYAQMSHYMSLWKSMCIDPMRTSEELLKDHLCDIPIQRFPLAYRLVLSNIKVIAIAGDSGSGKTTFCRLIRPFFLFDKVMEFETDRYHKWERGHECWKTMSHLNPNANYLEKLEEDTFNLKLGNAIVSVDYDHKTGTFTPPQTLEPKEHIILCGLHTLYSKQLRTLSDLKLYIDTSDELKLQWKLKRDMEERGHSQEKILMSIETRRPEYELYVSPQKEYADIVIRLSSTELALCYQTGLSYEWVREFPCTIDGSTIVFTNPNVDARLSIRRFILALDLPPVEEELGFNGILQLMFIRALYG